MSSPNESSLTGQNYISYANTSYGPITEAQHYGQDTAKIDPDLGQLIEAWPNTAAGDPQRDPGDAQGG